MGRVPFWLVFSTFAFEGFSLLRCSQIERAGAAFCRCEGTDLPLGLLCLTGGALNAKGFPSTFFFFSCANNRHHLYLHTSLPFYSLPALLL